jgi:hypothetical protein
MTREQVLGSIEARLHDRRVLAHRTGQRARILRVVGSLRVTVHVSDDGRIALRGELTRLVVHVLGDTPPFVHYDDSRALRLVRLVVDDESFQDGAAVAVGHRLFLDHGRGRPLFARSGTGREH